MLPWYPGMLPACRGAHGGQAGDRSFLTGTMRIDRGRVLGPWETAGNRARKGLPRERRIQVDPGTAALQVSPGTWQEIRVDPGTGEPWNTAGDP